MHLRDGFATALAAHDLEQLDRLPTTAFAVDASLTIAFTNAAWDHFATTNGGDARRWGLGARFLDAISGPLRQFYADAFASAMESRQPWSHDYECSSPHQYRRFRMTVYPLPDAAGVLVVNVLSAARPIDRRVADADAASYIDEHGLIHQCSHCRCVRLPGPVERWDWVPDLVARHDARVSHGLCGPCLAHHYR